jgi:hypothetical protein
VADFAPTSVRLDDVASEIGRRLALLPSDSLGGPISDPALHEAIPLGVLDVSIPNPPATQLSSFVRFTGETLVQIKDRDRPIGYAITGKTNRSDKPDSVQLVAADFALSADIDRVISVLENALSQQASVSLLHVPEYFTWTFWIVDGEEKIAVIQTPFADFKTPTQNDHNLYTPANFLKLLAQLTPVLGVEV